MGFCRQLWSKFGHTTWYEHICTIDMLWTYYGHKIDIFGRIAGINGHTMDL